MGMGEEKQEEKQEVTIQVNAQHNAEHGTCGKDNSAAKLTSAADHGDGENKHDRGLHNGDVACADANSGATADSDSGIGHASLEDSSGGASERGDASLSLSPPPSP